MAEEYLDVLGPRDDTKSHREPDITGEIYWGVCERLPLKGDERGKERERKGK